MYPASIPQSSSVMVRNLTLYAVQPKVITKGIWGDISSRLIYKIQPNLHVRPPVVNDNLREKIGFKVKISLIIGCSISSKCARGAVSLLAVIQLLLFSLQTSIRKKRRQVPRLHEISINCFLLKHDTKVWPFPKVYAGDGGQLARASSRGALVGRGQVCLCSSPPESLLVGHVMVSFHLFPDCNAKKCHDDQPPVTNSTGAPNGNFWKISVRKTIWDLEFSEHLL